MGTEVGPSYANLFVGFIEHQFFCQYHGLKPELYCRYIDDCVGAANFPFVNGRCHLKRSMPSLGTVVAIENG